MDKTTNLYIQDQLNSVCDYIVEDIVLNKDGLFIIRGGPDRKISITIDIDIPIKGFYQSKDGLRMYRPPSFKSRRGATQANFEWRSSSNHSFKSGGNAHIDIIEGASK